MHFAIWIIWVSKISIWNYWNTPKNVNIKYGIWSRTYELVTSEQKVFEEGSRNLFSKQTVLRVALQDVDTVQSCNFGLFWDSTQRFFEAPTLDQAPVKFFLISNSVNDVNVGYFHIKYST